jgi:hypothetical protein
MTLENLEAAVLLLPKQSQVVLLARMLERLGQYSAASDLGRIVLKNCYNAGMDFEWNESKAAVNLEKHV